MCCTALGPGDAALALWLLLHGYAVQRREAHISRPPLAPRSPNRIHQFTGNEENHSPVKRVLVGGHM
jgi:hypothetical protein